MHTLIALARILLLCMVISGEGGAPASAPGSPALGDGPRLTEREIRAFMVEIAPRIERVMERKLKKLPPLVIDDTEAMARILAADMVPLLRRQYPGWPEGRISRHALVTAKHLVPGLLGKYGVQAETLALCPAHLPDTLREHRIDPIHAPGIWPCRTTWASRAYERVGIPVRSRMEKEACHGRSTPRYLQAPQLERLQRVPRPAGTGHLRVRPGGHRPQVPR